MKNTILLLALCTCISCTKSNTTYSSFKSTATVTGEDYTMCACCGGYLITIGQDHYEFNNFPAHCNIDSTHFPIKVALNWHSISSCSTIPHIMIDSLVVIN